MAHQEAALQQCPQSLKVRAYSVNFALNISGSAPNSISVHGKRPPGPRSRGVLGWGVMAAPVLQKNRSSTASQHPRSECRILAPSCRKNALAQFGG